MGFDITKDGYVVKKYPTNAEQTDNPLLFSKFYWGHGTVSTDSKGVPYHPEVYDNRNLFNDTIRLAMCPSTYNLKKIHFAGDVHNRYETNLHDHHEEYSMKHPNTGTLSRGRVILVSPYGGGGHEELTQRGFLRIISMYGGARTYIKIVDDIYNESPLFKAGGSIAVAASLGYDIRPLLFTETPVEPQTES